MTPQDKLKTAINIMIIRSREEDKDNNFEEVLRLFENYEHETFQFFPMAIFLVVKAIEEDNNKNYEDALKLYETGVDHFLQAIKDEIKEEKAKEQIRATIKKFGERAEEIRQYLEKFKSQEQDYRPRLLVLGKAISLVTKAVEEDTNRNYAEAVRLYEEGIEHFTHVMKYDAEGERAKACIQSKIKEYDERVEKLRKYLEKKRMELDNDSESDSDNEDEMFNKKHNQSCWIC